MDDEELTQDILDQFDLICTQQQQQKQQNVNVTVDRFPTFARRGNGSEFTGAREVQRTLSRTSSLDGRKTGSTDAFADHPEMESSALVERLTREVGSLREELYMKLGELATLKDSASRANAQKSDAIVRLETNLACQREEFQRKISELSAQLASKEADYRTLTTELALVREQLVTTRSSVAPDRFNDFSPASQLIASMMTSPFDIVTPNGLPNKAPQSTLGSPSSGHLPVPVTPVPSRRRLALDGTWQLGNLTKLDPASRGCVGAVNYEKMNMQQEVLQANISESAQYCQQEYEKNPPKRRRKNRSLSESPVVSEVDHILKPMLVDAAVGTNLIMDDKPNSNSGRLRYRSNALQLGSNNSGYFFTKPPSLHSLASSLLRINRSLSNTGIPQAQGNKENLTPSAMSGRALFSFDVPSTNIFHDSSKADEYLFGLSSLLSADCNDPIEFCEGESIQVDLSAVITRAVDSVPHLLIDIERSLQEALSALRWKREPSLSHQTDNTEKSFGQAVEEGTELITLESASLCPVDEGGISYLGEDPFAGAPASQMVTPLNTLSNRSVLSVTPINPIRTPSQLCLSAPADFHSAVGSDSSRRKSTHTLPLPVQKSLEQGICAVKRIQRLLETFRLWNLSVFGVSSDDRTHMHENLQMLSVATSDLLARFIDGLAEYIVWRCLMNSPSNHRVTASNIQSLPNQLLSSQSEPGRQPSVGDLDSAHLDSSFPEEVTQYLALFSNLSLNLATLAACCVDSVKSESESNKRIFVWKLSPLSCMIITVGMSYPSETNKGPWQPMENSDTFPSSVSCRWSKVILFVQLLRYMVSRGHWNLGHLEQDWPAQWLQASMHIPHTEINELSYLRRMFCSDMKCPLLSIALWISRIGEVLYAMERNFVSFTEAPLYTPDRSLKKSTHLFVRLLQEFSGFVAVLTARSDIMWPDSCPCKAQTYSTLISLAVHPLEHLHTLPSTVAVNADFFGLKRICNLWSPLMDFIAAFGQLSRALTGLLWRHGDNCFQSYTDSLPSYFFVISGLSAWIKQSKALMRSSFTSPFDCVDQNSMLRPELVEELFDFDLSPENASKV